MLAFLKGAVRDVFKQAGIVLESADIAPVDLVWVAVEMVVAEVCQAGEHLVDLGLFAEEGGKRCVVVALLLCGAKLMAVRLLRVEVRQIGGS